MKSFLKNYSIDYNVLLWGTLAFVFLTHIFSLTGFKGVFVNVLSFLLLCYVTFRTFKERKKGPMAENWKLLSLKYFLCVVLFMLALYVLYGVIA